MHTTPATIYLQILNSMYTSYIVCMRHSLPPSQGRASASAIHFFLLAEVEVEATLPSFFKPTADAMLPMYGM
jgi:hypothetical protein